MDDLSGVNGMAIAQGNARRSQVQDLNDRIQQHNTDIAAKLTEAAGTNRTADQIRDAQQIGQGIWTGTHMPNKVKAFNDWRAGGSSSKPNVTADAQARQTAAVDAAGPPATTPTEAPTTTNLTDTEHSDVFESDAATGMSEGTGLGEKALGAMSKAGKVSGGLLSAAAGGIDIYDDIKAGGIAGNNNWDKAGNVLQIGGSVADLVGMVFPPAALIGGVLDLASAATTEVGDAMDEHKTAADLKPTIAANTVSAIAAPMAQSTVVGDVK